MNRRKSTQESQDKRKTIAVIFGGCSPEYGVSLQSAYAVVSHMDRGRFKPVLIGISRQGDWYYYEGDSRKIADDTWLDAADCVPVTVSFSRLEHAILKITKSGIEKIRIDALFPVLHGRNGEDGTVQGLCELAGIPVVGCGTLASALCMDKYRAHALAGASGIAVPASFVIGESAGAEEIRAYGERLGYPLFVKPVRAGSSYGITRVTDSNNLSAAIKSALAYDDRVILEENIDGFEVGCAIIGDRELKVGEVDEIELSEGFFDFAEKYSLKTSRIHVPARIDSGTAEKIKETAKRIYRALGCSGFARVDMFLTPTGEIFFNEVNTIPGFTAHSRFPNMLKATGMSFEEIITAVIETAVQG